MANYPSDTTLTLVALNADPRPGYLVETTDSTWGTKHKRITNTHPWRNLYPKQMVENSNGTRLFLGFGFRMLNGTTYADQGDAARPFGVEYPIWSNVNPDYMYGCSDGQNTLKRWSVAAGAWSVRHTFTGWGHMTFNYEGNISANDNRIAIIYNTLSNQTGTWGVVIYDPVNDVVISSLATGTGAANKPNNANISRSGAYVTVQHGADGGGTFQGTKLYNSANMALIRTIQGAGQARSHGDMARDAAGADIYAYAKNNNVVSHRLSDGTETTLLPSGNALFAGASGHVSGQAIDLLGWVFVNSSGTSANPGRGQLVAVKTDGSQTVRVYGFDHAGPSEPLGCPSRDGARYFYGSPWGGDPNTQMFGFVAYANQPPIRYVAVTGNNSTGTGLIGAPWATLAHALANTPVGYTIQMRGGTYGNTFSNGRDTVILENYPGENVIIQRTTAGSVLQFENARNVTVRKNPAGGSFAITSTLAGNGQNNGLHIYYDSNRPGFVPTNFLIDGLYIHDIAGRGMRVLNASNVTVQNVESAHNAMGMAFQAVTGASFIQDNLIHHIDRMLVSDPGGNNDAGGTGVELNMYTSGVIVRRNLIYECHAPSMDYFVDGGTVDMFGNDHCTVEDNIAYNNNGFIETGTNPGPTMDGNIIRRNIFYGRMNWNPGDPGNFLYHRAGTNLLVYNNTIFMDDAGASGLTFHGIAAGSGFWAPVDGFKFKNNLMVFSSAVTEPYRIYNTTGNTGVEINYNLIYKLTGSGSKFVDSNNYGVHQGTALAAWRAASPYSDNDIWNANPLFVNQSARDFRLAVGSPAINTGAVIPGTTDGYLGSAPDIGRYESNFATTAVTGSATLAKGWSTAGVGKAANAGAAASSFRFATAATAIGTLNVSGAVTLTKGWSTAAAGQQGLAAVTGTVTLTKGFSASGVAKVSFLGQGAASFGWAAGGVGKPGYAGVAALAKGFSTAAVGAQAFSGGLAASAFRFSTAGVAVERISATSATSFTFSSSSVGTTSAILPGTSAVAFNWEVEAIGGIETVGDAASEFGWSAAAVSEAIAEGDAASEFGWSSEAVALVLDINEGISDSTFTWGSEGTGVAAAQQPGQADSTFTWTTEATGALLSAVAGPAASTFLWAAGANGNTTGVIDPVPPPKKPKKKGRKHWPWPRHHEQF